MTIIVNRKPLDNYTIKEDGDTIAHIFEENKHFPTHTYLPNLPISRIVNVEQVKNSEIPELRIELELTIPQMHRFVHVLQNVLAEVDQEA